MQNRKETVRKALSQGARPSRMRGSCEPGPRGPVPGIMWTRLAVALPFGLVGAYLARRLMP